MTFLQSEVETQLPAAKHSTFFFKGKYDSQKYFFKLEQWVKWKKYNNGIACIKSTSAVTTESMGSSDVVVN